MLFSERDIDILRLLAWCRFVMPESLAQVATDTELANLTALGLMTRHEKSGAMVLTEKGRRFLQENLGNAPAAELTYHAEAIQRHLRRSTLALTAYRAGLQVFTTEAKALQTSPSFFMPTMHRGRGANPWGSTRVAALLRVGDILGDVHFVYSGCGNMALTDELTLFTNNTAAVEDVRRAFIFAGESYKAVLDELNARESGAEKKLVSYAEAYRRSPLPVHILSCGDAGARQLQLMSVPGYRRRLAELALRKQYVPPPKEMICWDALYNGTPLIIAADMDLRRLDAALGAAPEQLMVVTFREQAGAIAALYREQVRRLRFFPVKEELLSELTGRSGLYAPPNTQFITEEGGVIDVPPVRASAKSKRPPHKSKGPSEE